MSTTRMPHAGTPARALLLALLALLLPVLAAASNPAPLPHPDLPLWSGGTVEVVLQEPDGSLLVGGTFDFIKGVPRSGLARILPDGNVDPDFAPTLLPAQAGVNALLRRDDGSILVGGSFTAIGGRSNYGLALLSGETGAADPDFNAQTEYQGDVNLLEAGSDGVVYVAGFFQELGGQPRAWLAKLAADGTVDPDWNPAPNHHVLALEYDAATDSLFVGGSFTSIGGANRGSLARIDGSGTGSADDWAYNLNPYEVEALLLADGQLYLGGRYPITLSRVDAATAVPDSGWNPGVSSVKSLARDGDRLYVGGHFDSVGAEARNGVAAVSITDGSLVPGFAPTLAAASYSSLAEAEVFPLADGSVFLAGGFDYVNGEQRLGLARLDPNGALLAPAADTLRPGGATVLHALPDGGMLVGGNFHAVGSDAAIARGHLLALDANGALDPQWAPQLEGVVRSLVLSADGQRVYAGGDFSSVAGVATGHLVAMALDGDGSRDSSFSSAADAPVLALAAAPDGGVYAAGEFDTIGGAARPFLARLAADGSADAVFAATAAPDRAVTELALGDDGLFVAGPFSLIGTTPRARLARLDPSSGVAHAGWAADVDGATTALLLDGNDLYVGGWFEGIAGLARSHLARLDAGTGAVDSAFAPLVGDQVDAIVRAGPALFIGGGTVGVNGTFRLGAARLDAVDGALDPLWNPEFYDGNVHALAVASDGSLYAGGQFRNVYTTPRQGLAALPTVALPPVELSMSIGATPELLLEGKPVLVPITVGTSQGDPDDLVLSATSSRPEYVSNESLAAGLGGSGSDRTLLLQAMDDQIGPATITVSLSDGVNTVQAQFDVAVRPVNDAPTLSIDGNLFHAAGAIGPQVRIEFAHGEPNDPNQAVFFSLEAVRDPQGVVDSIVLHDNGTLQYTLSGAGGGAVFRVHAWDSGGTDFGGVDVAEPQEFRILVGEGANLSLSLEQLDPGAKRAAAASATLEEFVLRLTNHGPDDVPEGIVLSVPVPRGASGMLWSCTAPTASCQPPAGSGAVATSLGLAVGETAEIVISLQGSGNFLDIAASAALPAGMPAIDTGDSALRSSVPMSAEAIFRGSFE